MKYLKLYEDIDPFDDFDWDEDEDDNEFKIGDKVRITSKISNYKNRWWVKPIEYYIGKILIIHKIKNGKKYNINGKIAKIKYSLDIFPLEILKKYKV